MLLLTMAASLAQTARKPFVFDATPIAAAARDGDGVVWAIDSERLGGLFRWRGNGWAAAEIPPDLQRAWPASLSAPEGGEAHCLWRSDRTDVSPVTYWISRHRGGRRLAPRALSRPNGGLESSLRPLGPGVVAPGHHQHLSTGRRLGHAGAHDPAPVVSSRVEPPEWSESTPGGSRRGGQLLVSGRMDAIHTNRAWWAFWSVAARISPRIERSKACPKRRREGCSPRTPRPSGPSTTKPVSTRSIRPGRGRAPRSIPGASEARGVDRMIPVRANRWLACAPDRVWLVDDADKTCTLLPTEGADFSGAPDGACARTPEGCWFGTLRSGLAFFAEASRSLRVFGLRQAQVLHRVDRVFPLPDGRLLLAGFGEGAEAISPSELLAPRAPSARLERIPLDAGLAADARGHAWALLPEDGGPLSEWDGDRWVSHRMPAPAPRARARTLFLDSRGRVWLGYPSPSRPGGFGDHLRSGSRCLGIVPNLSRGPGGADEPTAWVRAPLRERGARGPRRGVLSTPTGPPIFPDARKQSFSMALAGMNGPCKRCSAASRSSGRSACSSRPSGG